jgi:putative endopeptidase
MMHDDFTGQCLCCKNPWNQNNMPTSATSGSDSGDSLEVSGGYMLCTPCLQDNKGFDGIDPANFDHTQSPKENFYLWSNGGWKDQNPIPKEYPSWNTFLVLRDLNLDRLKVILDDLGKADGSAPTVEDEVKLADFYTTYMDEDALEAVGIQPLTEMISLCQSVTTNVDTSLTEVVATLHSKYGVSVFFDIHSSPDKTNSEHSMCNLYQSGLGMPDKDYYIEKDKADKREKYLEYISLLFALLGERGVVAYSDPAVCASAARAVLALETSLAQIHLSRTDRRDPNRTWNKMDVDNLIRLSKNHEVTWDKYLTKGVGATGSFDWHKYFNLVGKAPGILGDINVATIDAISGFYHLLDNSTQVSHYLVFQCVNSFCTHLSAAFGTAHFNFHEKEMSGTAEQKPRWKKALSCLEGALGDALGQLYVVKHFPSDAKARALKIVESVRDALRERLEEVDWMSAETRVEALKKMEKFKVKIGFPDQWLDYSDLPVMRGEHFANVLSSRQYQHALELSRMNAPTDKGRWFMTPQTVNAYYHPSLNEIVFPAAILQAPFFDPNADAAVQYGSLGAVVGHEMTHGFDDQGRKYDSLGNLRDWWAEGDGPEYERRAAVMIRQAEQFEVHGNKLNGKLTCGENIADLGGVKLSLRALKKYLETETPSKSVANQPLINGFTPYQRLFLAWSQAWRENVKKERAIQLVTLDPHGPNELRCNGTLSNVQEFFEAFNIKEGSAMYKAVEDRVDIW